MTCPDAPIARPLEAIRAELDEIDQQIHELVVRRAMLAEEVRGAKTDHGAAALRPAREAQMLYRLAGFERGPMRLEQIWRLWRELIMANARLQFPFTVDTVAATHDLALWDAGRAHFCYETAMEAHDDAAEALARAASQPSRVALLPAGDPAWWPLIAGRYRAMRVFAALPMVAGDGNVTPRAMVAADVALAPSGHDVTVLHVAPGKIVGEGELRAALAAAGREVTYVIAGSGGFLAGISGFADAAAQAPAPAAIDGLAATVLGVHAAPVVPAGEVGR